MAMHTPPADLDATRRALVGRDLVATASAYLTTDIAMGLPFEILAAFKNLLRKFFSLSDWSEEDARDLSDLVAPHLAEGWWDHDLGSGLELAYGIRDGHFRLWVGGAGRTAPSIFDRVFDGPVIPEATPHPRKVKFSTGGQPAPGVWYRRHDPGKPDDARVERLFSEPDVTDVMVAGDFVTVGIGARSSWELRLEPLLALVTELFSDPSAARHQPARTREELLQEASRSHPSPRPEELHLLDPDDGEDRARLLKAGEDEDPRIRRIAVAILLEASDEGLRHSVLTRGLADPSRLVRRTAVDAAADTQDERYRSFFQQVLSDDDPWIRWKAVRALGEIGLAGSRSGVEDLEDDPDFQVRFEVARVLRAAG